MKEARTPTSVNQYVVNQRHLHPGIAGGASGSPDSCVISAGTDREVTVNPTVAGAVMETGDRLVYRFGGGGGWGDPLLRDPNAVLDDVWDEYVSIDAARDEYGVVITGSLEDMTLALDDDATAQSLDATRRRVSQANELAGVASAGEGIRPASERPGLMGYRIGIDVGGTFTDLVALDEDGQLVLEKTPTTPTDQSDGVMAGLEQLATAIGVGSAQELLARTDTIVHGTTTGDNTMIQMSGAADRACSSPTASATRSSCAVATRKTSGTRRSRARADRPPACASRSPSG